MNRNYAQLAVDAAFKTVGAPAVWRPSAGSDAVDCLIVERSPDEPQSAIGVRVNRRTMRIDVRLSDVAKPVKGGTFEYAGEIWRVIGDPARLDSARLIWSCSAEPAD